MNRMTIGVMFLLTGLGSGASGQELGFQFYKELKLPSLEQDELVAAQLDEAIYLAADDDLDDVRILDELGEPVPFLLKRMQTTRTRTSRRSWTARPPAARPLDDGGLEITLELHEDDRAPDGIRLVTPLRDFEQRVRVYSSGDGKEWEPRGIETVIFDYSRYLDARSDSVAFPATEHRHFRIVIDAVTSVQESQLLELTRRLQGGRETDREERTTLDRRPFRIERIEFWKDNVQERATGDEKTAYSIGEFRIEEDPEKQQTLIFVNTPRGPLTSFQLETSTRNFSRRVVVTCKEVRGTQTSWRTLSEGVLSRIDFKDLKREELKISFAESRHATYRIVVENRDSPPLTITGIQSEGNVYQLLFLPSAGKTYRLAYASDRAESPQYDTAAIKAVLNAGFDPSPAELGEQQSLAGPLPGASWLDQLLDPKILIGLLVLLVIVLGLALYSAVRRLDDLPPEKKGD